MKKFFLIIAAVTFIMSCQNQNLNSPDNHQMSGIIKGDDQHTKKVKKFMKAYVDNDMSSAKDVFSSDAVFYVNDTKLTIEDMMEGFSAGHQFFDNIAHNNVDMATMYYNNGSIYTNTWYDWSGENNSTGEKLNIKGYGWFKWENGKVVEAYNAFDPTAYSAAMNRQVFDNDPSTISLIESAKAFQNAYINNNYTGAKKHLSENFQTTIFLTQVVNLLLFNRKMRLKTQVMAGILIGLKCQILKFLFQKVKQLRLLPLILLGQ